VAEDHARGREALLQQRMLKSGGREDELGATVHEARAVGRAHEDREIREEERREHEIGFRGL
jgi:hypothetical protein